MGLRHRERADGSIRRTDFKYALCAAIGVPLAKCRDNLSIVLVFLVSS